MRSSLPLLSAILVFISMFAALMTTMALGGLLAAVAITLAQLSDPNVSMFEIILADPVSYAKGLLSVDYASISSRAVLVLDGLSNLDLDFTYDDPANNVYFDIPQNTANDFKSTVSDIKDYADTVQQSLSKAKNPLKDIAGLIPGDGSLTKSLLLPNPLGFVTPILEANLNGVVRNISATCEVANDGGYDDVIETALDGFQVSSSTIQTVLSYVKGGSKACKQYVNDLTGKFPPPRGPLVPDDATDDAQIIRTGLANFRAAAAAVAAGAIAGSVIGLIISLLLAIWSYQAVAAALYAVGSEDIVDAYAHAASPGTAHLAKSVENPISA